MCSWRQTGMLVEASTTAPARARGADVVVSRGSRSGELHVHDDGRISKETSHRRNGTRAACTMLQNSKAGHSRGHTRGWSRRRGVRRRPQRQACSSSGKGPRGAVTFFFLALFSLHSFYILCVCVVCVFHPLLKKRDFQNSQPKLL